MSEETIEDIRERKIEELRSGDAGGGAGTDGESGGETPSEPIHVDGAEEFESTVGAHDVVLVDFYADWCGPCKAIAPVVEELAAETDAAVAKVDVDANQRLASEYGVRGVPTLLVFADGEPAERMVGAQGEAQLRGALADHGAA